MGYALRKTFEHFILAVKSGWKRSLTNEPDVWRILWSPGHRKHGHAAEKPVGLMCRAIRLCNPPPGGIILDPFAGSGSTGKAAVREGFRYVLIEQDAGHCEIARKRIAAERSQPPLFAPNGPAPGVQPPLSPPGA